jgi:hypothetical protein
MEARRLGGGQNHSRKQLQTDVADPQEHELAGALVHHGGARDSHVELFGALHVFEKQSHAFEGRLAHDRLLDASCATQPAAVSRQSCSS